MVGFSLFFQQWVLEILKFFATSSKKESGSIILVAAFRLSYFTHLSCPHIHFLLLVPFFFLLSLKQVDRKQDPIWNESESIRMCVPMDRLDDAIFIQTRLGSVEDT